MAIRTIIATVSRIPHRYLGVSVVARISGSHGAGPSSASVETWIEDLLEENLESVYPRCRAYPGH